MAAEKRMLCNELFKRCITIMQQIVAIKRATSIKTYFEEAEIVAFETAAFEVR